MRKDIKSFKIGSVNFGRELVIIAGPCVIESREHTLFMAEELLKICRNHKAPFVFKSSYDKANRSSIRSYRGPGITKGLKILSEVKRKFGIPVISDVHNEKEVWPAAKVLDILQIPALLCRQTDLIVACAKTKRPINIKKGQFLAPQDMKNVIEKAVSCGNKQLLLTERGNIFGYNNLIVDMRSIYELRQFGYPVIFDATHSSQFPGAMGVSSGGEREYVPILSKAAVAAGCDGLFLEVHNDPDSAKCDGPNMIDLAVFEDLIKKAKEIYKIT